MKWKYLRNKRWKKLIMNMKKRGSNNKILRINKFKNLVKNSLKEKQLVLELLNLQLHLINRINMPIPHKLDR
jgi:hypothetical protein